MIIITAASRCSVQSQTVHAEFCMSSQCPCRFTLDTSHECADVGVVSCDATHLRCASLPCAYCSHDRLWINCESDQD